MIVTFVSQCQKKALAKTRQILDSFANRIGDNTWQTVITQEGLEAVRVLLRKSASKNTAVSCHRNRGYGHTELVWVVGNRRQFNALGHVPVHRTQSARKVNEDNWVYLDLMRSLVAMAALFHDWGKASQRFQAKLNPTKNKKGAIADPLRHEWISCLLLHAFVHLSEDVSDEDWLARLMEGSICEKELKQRFSEVDAPLKDLPLAAQWIAWLVLTHHRLPTAPRGREDKNNGALVQGLSELLELIEADFGYQNIYTDKNYAKQKQECFVFPKGLLSQSAPWLKGIKRWSRKLKEHLPLLTEAFESGAWRSILFHARLSLMLGDHYYSSQAGAQWETSIGLFANTRTEAGTEGQKHRVYNQYLDQHLIHVAKEAVNITRLLPMCQQLSQDRMAVVQDVHALKKRSTSTEFAWQDKAVKKIKTWRTELAPNLKSEHQGFFVVNMASTGAGKTFANAKIMRALSFDGNSLRYVLALGLRTLTLQTGDEYRERIGLTDAELAVQIGSQAVMDLHALNKKTPIELPFEEETGSASQEPLLDESVLDYDGLLPESQLATVLQHNKGKKNAKFLYAPVLACTIDHLMGATETRRGGRYILPSLRLMSSDLVIDEIDDFTGDDLIAIGRLIHLAGMFGRKVMISSATIPPDLAEGYFNAYREGWLIHQAFHAQRHNTLNCAWIDEFKTDVYITTPSDTPTVLDEYRRTHTRFVERRVKKLAQTPIRRKGVIVESTTESLAQDYSESETLKERFYRRIQDTILTAHARHHFIDISTQKRVSFGVVRMANIEPCIALSQFLMASDWTSGVAPRVMAYHSRQVMLLRSEQEKHLDQVLKRKEKPGQQPASLIHPVIRAHLDQTDAEDVIFILVATPVEETGRDHDFDWAVVEPSSYRSIIQLAGRVRRHRKAAIADPNIYLMQYNLKALAGKSPAYEYPGYESRLGLLDTHDLRVLLQTVDLQQSIDATPRIQKPVSLSPSSSLVDLEHETMKQLLTQYEQIGPQCLQGWLTQLWWMTAIPMQLSPFRQSLPTQTLKRVFENEQFVFQEEASYGQWEPCSEMTIRQSDGLSVQERERLWLYRDYEAALQSISEMKEISLRRASYRYGEVNVPANTPPQGWVYSDQWGVSGACD